MGEDIWFQGLRSRWDTWLVRMCHAFCGLPSQRCPFRPFLPTLMWQLTPAPQQGMGPSSPPRLTISPRHLTSPQLKHSSFLCADGLGLTAWGTAKGMSAPPLTSSIWPLSQTETGKTVSEERALGTFSRRWVNSARIACALARGRVAWCPGAFEGPCYDSKQWNHSQPWVLYSLPSPFPAWTSERAFWVDLRTFVHTNMHVYTHIQAPTAHTHTYTHSHAHILMHVITCVHTLIHMYMQRTHTYTCTCKHTHTCTDTYVHTQAYTCSYMCIHKHTHTYTRPHKHTCTHIHTCCAHTIIHTYPYTCTHTNIHIDMHAHTKILIHIHINMHTRLHTCTHTWSHAYVDIWPRSQTLYSLDISA